MLGMPVQTWLMVYQFSGPTTSAPFAAGDGIHSADSKHTLITPNAASFGSCVDERNGEPTWPFTPITGATYNTLNTVGVTGPGITGTLDVVETNPPNTVGNSTFRSYGFTYGGGAPGDPPGGFNGTLTAAESTPDSDYVLDIGEGSPMTYHMPAAFTAPLGIGVTMTVNFPDAMDLTYTWPTPKNHINSDGSFNYDTYFNFTLFADPTSTTNPALFICFPTASADGTMMSQTIPAAVISALPASGLIVNADLSHYMEARDAMGGETRRFDLVSIYCNISLYNKQ